MFLSFDAKYCGFCFACGQGHLEVCGWLRQTFYFTKEDIPKDKHKCLQPARMDEHYKIISFLCIIPKIVSKLFLHVNVR